MSDRDRMLLWFFVISTIATVLLALISTGRTMELAQQNRLLRDQAEICKTALTASQAKLEMVNDLFTTARGSERRAIGIGGE